MKKNVCSVITVGMVIMLTSGCQMFKSPPPEDPVEITANVFDFGGIPSADYYVGGGFIIRYRARQHGILYIAENESGRLLGTISMTEGEKYEVLYDINDADMIENLKAVGIDPEKALIKIYFVPKENF